MIKITFVGAGSAVFGRQVRTGIPTVDPLGSGELAVVDIHASATWTGGIDAPGR